MEAFIFMSLLALQFGIQPGLTRAYAPHSISKSSFVLLQEGFKFVFATMGLFAGGKQKVNEALEGWKISYAIKIASIPAFLYLIQNLASLLAYQNLQPLTFNVLNQTKTLSAALCCYLVIGRKQSKLQICSLFLLLGSALTIEKINPFAFLFTIAASATATATTKTTATATAAALSRHWTHGVAPVLLASFVSGLAGAFSQKLLQSESGCGKTGGRNPFLFSMEMNLVSFLILLVSLKFSADGQMIASNGFFHGWTPYTIIPVTTNALGGIIVGLVTKYAGSVKKGFALIFGILISGIMQAMSGGGGIQAEQIIGGVLAALSLWMHTAFPYKEKASSITK